MSALAAVDSSEARTAASDDSVLTDKLRGAQALSELAEQRLYERGVAWSSPEYEQAYLGELAAISRETGLAYDNRGA